MTRSRSLFFDDWQDCLRAHYVHVVRTQDTLTQPTLRQVLLNTGLSEDDLRALEAYALDQPPPDPAAEDADRLPTEEAAPYAEVEYDENQPLETVAAEDEEYLAEGDDDNGYDDTATLDDSDDWDEPDDSGGAQLTMF